MNMYYNSSFVFYRVENVIYSRTEWVEALAGYRSETEFTKQNPVQALGVVTVDSGR